MIIVKDVIRWFELRSSFFIGSVNSPITWECPINDFIIGAFIGQSDSEKL